MGFTTLSVNGKKGYVKTRAELFTYLSFCSLNCNGWYKVGLYLKHSSFITQFNYLHQICVLSHSVPISPASSVSDPSTPNSVQMFPVFQVLTQVYFMVKIISSAPDYSSFPSIQFSGGNIFIQQNCGILFYSMPLFSAIGSN